MKLIKYLYHVLTIKDMCYMMEFILWVISTKIVSQVAIIKKIVIILMIIDNYCRLLLIIINDYYWWLLKKTDKINFSSNIIEVIRIVLNFFYYKIS